MGLHDFPGLIDFGEEPEESYRWCQTYCTVCGHRASLNVTTGERSEGIVKMSPRMIEFTKQCTCAYCGGAVGVRVFDHYPSPEELR